MRTRPKPVFSSQPSTQDITANVYDDGYLRVEHDNYYIACGDHSIKLPRTEFLIISRLTLSFERVVSAEDLWRYVWGDRKPFNSVSLRVYVYRLRHRLAPYGLHIETMVNVGYRLSAGGGGAKRMDRMKRDHSKL